MEEAFHLPFAEIDELVGIEKAQEYLETAAKKWKADNPDPYFVIPTTFEGRCKKFGVVRFRSQKEWIDWVNNFRMLGPVSLRVERRIACIKKLAAIDRAITYQEEK